MISACIEVRLRRLRRRELSDINIRSNIAEGDTATGRKSNNPNADVLFSMDTFDVQKWAEKFEVNVGLRYQFRPNWNVLITK